MLRRRCLPARVHPLLASLITLILACGWCVPPAPGAGADSAGPDSGLITVTTPRKEVILAELADTQEKRARGLMFRDFLPKDRGMLFTFSEPQHWAFWMKNTRIALDIIWMDGQKRIVYVERNVPGCSRTDEGCPQYQPTHEAMYVLEVAAGMAEALQLQRGVKLQFQVPSSTGR
jgi:uncharacterized protein